MHLVMGGTLCTSAEFTSGPKGAIPLMEDALTIMAHLGHPPTSISNYVFGESTPRSLFISSRVVHYPSPCPHSF